MCNPDHRQNSPRQDIEQPGLSLKLVLSWVQLRNKWSQEAPAHLNFLNQMPEFLFTHLGITYPKILLFWTVSNETVQSIYGRDKNLTNYWQIVVIDGDGEYTLVGENKLKTKRKLDLDGTRLILEY